MKMEPVYADQTASANGPTSPASVVLGSVRVTPEKQQLIGVEVERVQKTSGTRVVRVLGKVALDETRVYRVASAVDGWVRSSGPIVSGSLVQKDEILATYYNRDFLTAQQTYLYALNTMDRAKETESGEQIKMTQVQIRSAEENLEFLGMGQPQIQEIARTRQIARNIELRSPVAGVVLARNAFPGLRFDRGTELFRVGDLNHVWIVADVFGNEAEDLKPGTAACVRIHGESAPLEAKVCNGLPQFNPVTRALQVRLEAGNADYRLRPDMFVDVELTVPFSEAMVVGRDAILDSGMRKTVFVESGPGVFEPREVELGWSHGGQVQVVKGLMGDERIVVSGNFLLDSESRMKLAAAEVQSAPMTDPVCGMKVNEARAKTARLTSEHEGKRFVFCSESCKAQFDGSPGKFIVAAMTQPGHETHAP
jgi:RND family efflux transporter MFP subunit